MKRLLRGIIAFDDKTPMHLLVANFRRLRTSGYQWQPTDKQIFDFCADHLHRYMEMPSVRSLVDYYEVAHDTEALERLKDISSAQLYTDSGYARLLDDELEKQVRVKMRALVKETNEILERGLTFGEGQKKRRVQGPREALVHFTEKGHDLLPPVGNALTRGDLRDTVEWARERYHEAEINKSKVYGAFMGLNHVDTQCHGCKRGELWLHAAFPGELKTATALNWAYHLVTRYRHNVFYVNLEMKYEQVMTQVYVLHSSHAKWGRPPLDYRKARDGELSPKDKDFYFEVLNDFESNPEYCRFELWCPDHNVTIQSTRTEAETLHRKMDVGMTFIDHGGIVTPPPDQKGKGTTEALNAVIRETKKFALHFNNGEGMAICMLFQINRLGKDDADKNEGRYKMKALSYANECLVEGTLVRTANGLVPIECVPKGMRVWSSTGWKTVQARLDNGIRETVEVRTSGGQAIRVTPDHLFRTLTPEGKVGWTAAAELRGRCVLSDLVTSWVSGKAVTLPPLVIQKYEKPSGEQSTPLQTPKVMTPELAYLLGAHDGDGLALDAYRVGWTGNLEERAVCCQIQTAFKATFGHEIKETNCPSRPGSFELTKWSKPLKRWCLEVGMDRQPCISPYVLQAGSEVQCSYLRGLWDTDGSINNQGVLSINMAAVKEPLLRQAQLLLAGLGIASTLRPGKDRCLLWITSQDARDRFAAVIGLSESWKHRRLQLQARKRPLEKGTWPLGEVYLKLYERYARKRGCLDGMVFHRTCSVAATQVRKGRRDVPQGALVKLLSALGGVCDDQVDFLKALVLNCRPQIVESVTPAGKAPVYDLDVGGDHEFSAGGLLVHNCERSADYITTTYLNDELRESGETIMCNLKNRDNPIFNPIILNIDWGSRRLYDRSVPGEDDAVEDADLMTAMA